MKPLQLETLTWLERWGNTYIYKIYLKNIYLDIINNFINRNLSIFVKGKILFYKKVRAAQ